MLTLKMRRDWHYYAVAIGLIFILNGVVGLLGRRFKLFPGTADNKACYPKTDRPGHQPHRITLPALSFQSQQADHAIQNKN